VDLISVLANVVMRIPTIFCIVPTTVPRRNVDHQNTATFSIMVPVVVIVVVVVVVIVVVVIIIVVVVVVIIIIVVVIIVVIIVVGRVVSTD